MTNRVFIDTNMLVYSFLKNDIEKHARAVEFFFELLAKEVFISTQVISELYSALSKHGIKHDKIIEYLAELEEDMNVCPIKLDTVKKCLDLKKRYLYSYWDSLILAAALENFCIIVYSEDMQHEQIIENKLTIINPFKHNFRD